MKIMPVVLSYMPKYVRNCGVTIVGGTTLGWSGKNTHISMIRSLCYTSAELYQHRNCRIAGNFMRLRMASVWVAHDVLSVLHSVLKMFHDALLCLTMFYDV